MQTPSVPQELDARTQTALYAMMCKALAAYPDEQARIERGAQLALQGHVTLHDDGSATVRSSDTTQTYYCLQRTCLCWDFRRAPGGRCKHRFGATLLRRAYAHLFQAPHAMADPQEPYEFPGYTVFAATYVGEGIHQGANGRAHKTAEGFLFAPDDQPYHAIACTYAEVALGPGIL